MLVLTRRPGESVILTYPTELDLEPITITILEDGKTGIDAQQTAGRNIVDADVRYSIG